MNPLALRFGRLRHRRLQTTLAILALATAVALPVTLLSVGEGVYQHELRDLQQSGYELDVTTTGVHGVEDSHGLSDRILALPQVAFASPVLSSSVELFVDGGATPALAEGVIPAQFDGTLVASESSLFPHPLPLGDPEDVAHYANGSYAGPSAGRVLVSTPIALAERLDVGSMVQVAGDDDRSDARNFTVAGTFGVGGPSLGTAAVFGLVLPLSDLQLLSGVAHGGGGSLLDASDTVEVALSGAAAADPGSVNAVASAIQAIVPYYTVTTVNDAAAQLESAQAVLTAFYLGLSAVGLVVGVAFLALLLLREVETDRRTLGIRRALGIPSRDIAAGILQRGGLLSLAGVAFGILLGIGVVTVLGRYGTGTAASVAQLAVFDPTTLLELTGLVVALGSLASGWAVRAALRRPLPELLR